MSYLRARGLCRFPVPLLPTPLLQRQHPDMRRRAQSTDSPCQRLREGSRAPRRSLRFPKGPSRRFPSSEATLRGRCRQRRSRAAWSRLVRPREVRPIRDSRGGVRKPHVAAILNRGKRFVFPTDLGIAVAEGNADEYHRNSWSRAAESARAKGSIVSGPPA